MGGPAFTNTTPFVNAGIGADLIAALDVAPQKKAGHFHRVGSIVSRPPISALSQ